MPIPDSSRACSADFVDRHIHGIAGVDFATSSVADIRSGLEYLYSRRTRRVTASIPTVDITQLSSSLERLGPLVVAGLLEGVHLEGPFIARDYAGAHPVQAVLSPASSQGSSYLEAVLAHQRTHGVVTMMTLAPELEGFDTLVEALVAHGIAPALGHTDATYEQMAHAITVIHALTEAPVVITHAYNAMRGFHHRDPGPMLAVLEAAANDRVIVELIADGRHVHLGLIRWWFAHHPEAIRLVSDASAATVPPGGHPIGDSLPRLGHAQLDYPELQGPVVTDDHTLASGAKDLLAIHDDLVAAGVDHAAVCAAMRH